MMVLLISNNMNAAAKNTPVELDGLRKAVDLMLASFEKSTKALRNATEDKERTMAAYGDILDQIKYGIKQTAKDGSMYKLLTKAVNLANRQAKWCEEQGETRYNELAKAFKQKAENHQRQLKAMLNLNGKLAELQPVIEGDKKYSHALYVLGDFEMAEKAMNESIVTMKGVIDRLSQIKEKEFKVFSKR